MASQLSLLSARGQRTLQPKGERYTAHLIDALTGRGWISAKVLIRELGLSDRQIRAGAQASKGQVLSGQQGYRLTREATLAEIATSRNWLLSQANEMRRRALDIDTVRHTA